MATPSLRLIREHLAGAFIGALVRPGVDQVLEGLPFFDDLHVERAAGVMGPKRAAAAIRPRRYELAILFTNSFSTALITRIAGVPERIGYDRDGRGFLLTDRLLPPRRRDTQPYARSTADPAAFAPISAVDYYHALTRHALNTLDLEPGPPGPLELTCTHEDQRAAAETLDRAGLPPERRRSAPIAILNPGGNNPAKRWPTERFAALADYLATHQNLTIAIAGSPGERSIADEIEAHSQPTTPILNLPKAGLTIPALKAIIASARILITNDTGPRHIAAALGIPVVTLFGPTDHRWSSIPHRDEARILADPDLPEAEVANDHPERTRIERIGLGDVVAAANRLLSTNQPDHAIADPDNHRPDPN